MSRVWFVTGSSRGLGRALVEYALSKGDSVVATARNKDVLSDVLKKYGKSKVLLYSLDVVNYESAVAAVHAAVNKFKRIDILVNNAGYANPASFEDSTLESFNEQIDVNFNGVVNVTKAILPILRQQGSGYIFNVSSLGSRLGTPGLSAYQAAKWAVSGFSSVLASELGPLNIKVTSLEPGGIRTDWAGSSMTIPPISDAYQDTVGALCKLIRDNNGKEPSLPEKFGPILEKLYATPKPPVRLLIGTDAVQYGAHVDDVQRKSDEEWKELGLLSV
ncbi:uncharacterized protein Z520_12343 [Fonsecaea multimorphosa CBS 102226]|uniref:Ketoreductase domain-containing protein n=1 Tax=Fonsecaea multimorphosa CBS 102226 TaxID=1442371 RepID=A0A0D2JNA8_9EURO|nr:uncharacterized protein Z520_12343 [Fonsecaea multimorphosa CBS 102226]KIX91954.1 hypothetical protein Z520_12343 [Fonsecaea multimorphosa CBS 102226]OAL17325.1 hypothetical protein AYO22_11767 [Fonsecaea multimorphosa]